MKRIHVKNGLVDSIELNITDLSTQQGSYVVADDVEVFAKYTDNGNETFTAPTKPEAPPHSVSKYTIITRLEASGKFEAALAALKSDDLLYEKWSAIPAIHSDDQPARDLFTAIGCDPDEILAKEI